MIRPAAPSDVPVIRQLIVGLAEYEKLAVSATEAELREHLFGPRPYAEVVLAEENGVAAGMAIFFHTYATFLGKPGLYLEDLFVRPEFRGQGHGKALIAEVARIARERGCGWLQWVVLDWNESAIRFYRSLGAEPMDEWTIYRLSGEALAAVARVQSD